MSVVLARCEKCRLVTSLPLRLYRRGRTRCGVDGCQGRLVRSRWLEGKVRRNARGDHLREKAKRRPEPSERPPVEGSPCERCNELTPEIGCIFADYWVCPRCAAFFDGLRRYAANVLSATRHRLARCPQESHRVTQDRRSENETAHPSSPSRAFRKSSPVM
jgi:hypothetical protein